MTSSKQIVVLYPRTNQIYLFDLDSKGIIFSMPWSLKIVFACVAIGEDKKNLLGYYVDGKWYDEKNGPGREVEIENSILLIFDDDKCHQLNEVKFSSLDEKPELKLSFSKNIPLFSVKYCLRRNIKLDPKMKINFHLEGKPFSFAGDQCVKDAELGDGDDISYCLDEAIDGEVICYYCDPVNLNVIQARIDCSNCFENCRRHILTEIFKKSAVLDRVSFEMLEKCLELWNCDCSRFVDVDSSCHQPWNRVVFVTLPVSYCLIYCSCSCQFKIPDNREDIISYSFEKIPFIVNKSEFDACLAKDVGQAFKLAVCDHKYRNNQFFDMINWSESKVKQISADHFLFSCFPKEDNIYSTLQFSLSGLSVKQVYIDCSRSPFLTDIIDFRNQLVKRYERKFFYDQDILLIHPNIEDIWKKCCQISNDIKDIITVEYSLKPNWYFVNANISIYYPNCHHNKDCRGRFHLACPRSPLESQKSFLDELKQYLISTLFSQDRLTPLPSSCKLVITSSSNPNKVVTCLSDLHEHDDYEVTLQCTNIDFPYEDHSSQVGSLMKQLQCTTLDDCKSDPVFSNCHTCCICFDEDIDDKDIYLLNCQYSHRLCCECAFHLVRSALGFNNEDGQKIVPACPMANYDDKINHRPGCKYVMDFNDIQQILSFLFDHSKISLIHKKKYEKQFEKLCNRRFHIMNEEFQCPTCVKNNSDEEENCQWFEYCHGHINCPSCRTSFCADCKRSPYHFGIVCDDYMSSVRAWNEWNERGYMDYIRSVQEDEEEFKRLQSEHQKKVEEAEADNKNARERYQEMLADEDMKVRTCKRCPHCHRVVFKVDGCDSMTCGRNYHGGDQQNGCGGNFNWSSAPPYVADRGNGPTVHEVKSVAPKEAQKYHHMIASDTPFLCDCCHEEIVGPMLRCLNCESWNGCLSCGMNFKRCEKDDSQHNAQHICQVLMTSEK